MDLITSFNPPDVYRHYRLFNELKRELSDVIAGAENEYPTEIRLSHATEGSIKFTDAYILKRILHRYKPETILEVGSFLGSSTRWLLEVTKNWNTKVTAIDPNIRYRVFDNPRAILEKHNSRFYPERLEIITGFFGPYDDSVYHDYEQYEPKKGHEFVSELMSRRTVIDAAWNKKFDFVFIDGNHSYESVMNNFMLALGMLNDRGCICFHDALSWMGVYEALGKIRESYRNKARVNIYGKIDRKFFKPFNIHIDGIGLFRSFS